MKKFLSGFFLAIALVVLFFSFFGYFDYEKERESYLQQEIAEQKKVLSSLEQLAPVDDRSPLCGGEVVSSESFRACIILNDMKIPEVLAAEGFIYPERTFASIYADVLHKERKKFTALVKARYAL